METGRHTRSNRRDIFPTAGDNDTDGSEETVLEIDMNHPSNGYAVLSGGSPIGTDELRLIYKFPPERGREYRYLPAAELQRLHRTSNSWRYHRQDNLKLCYQGSGGRN
jgi:hypothetical protein